MFKGIKNRCIAFLTAAAAVCGIALSFMTAFSMKADAAQMSGTCGDALKWVIDGEGTLTVSGRGDMTDWIFDSSIWYNREEIKKVVIEDGVTSIGDNAFYKCKNIERVIISATVTRIGTSAFDTASSLFMVNIPDSVVEIGSSAFAECTQLQTINIPDSVKKIGKYAFRSCYHLRCAVVGMGVSFIENATFMFCHELEKVIIMNDKCEIYDSDTTISNGSSYENGTEFNGVIQAPKGSPAEEYAKKYSYTFEDISQTSTVWGDANSDGKCDIRDAAYIAKMTALGKLSALPSNSDFNRDSIVNIRDAAAIAKHLASANT